MPDTYYAQHTTSYIRIIQNHPPNPVRNSKYLLIPPTHLPLHNIKMAFYLMAAKCNYFGGITFYQKFIFKCAMNNCAKIVINISKFLIPGSQILRIFLIKPAIMFSITKFRPFPKAIFIGNFLNFSFGVKLCRYVRVTSYHLIKNRQNTLNPRFYGRT